MHQLFSGEGGQGGEAADGADESCRGWRGGGVAQAGVERGDFADGGGVGGEMRGGAFAETLRAFARLTDEAGGGERAAEAGVGAAGFIERRTAGPADRKSVV